MEDPCRVPLHDSRLASRRAEEAAWRRFQAASWLDVLVGPIGLSREPTEREFLSCLRNGLVLCNAINKIQPGAIPKVVEIHSSSTPLEFQTLPAYQYFENVRNFLVAVKELKLPAFEASDLERDTLEAGSAAKIVDCILALKSYHEWKQLGGAGNGPWKYARSPLVLRSTGRANSRVADSGASDPCRQLDMLASSEKHELVETEIRKHGDLVEMLAKVLADCWLDSKENVDRNLFAAVQHRNQDSCKSLVQILSSCFREQLLNKLPELKFVVKDLLVEGNNSFPSSVPMPPECSSKARNYKCSKSCSRKGNCNHQHMLNALDKELLELKDLLLGAQTDFKASQMQLQSDLMQLGMWIQGLSTAALGYHQVVKENRDLYNTLQDLKGNIRVYCRIKPAFGTGIKSTVNFIGDDGSLIIVDPCKLQRDSQKVFQFNKVFGPNASQEEVFEDTRPLIRSVMDGHNVCIFAYGQTGSGKTHTMCGPSNGPGKNMGINYFALNDLFQISCERKDVMRYKVRVQMVEIYNEQIRDLLKEDSSTAKLDIRNCAGNNGFSLPDATMHLVQSPMDVLNLMRLGEMNRVTSSTAINNRSSRSHSVVTVHVQGKDASGSILRSCLHLVDLAGSERVDKSEVTGDGLKEAQHINRSLACLGDVITALAQKNSHIPYRNSKLTQMLQDSLGGHAKTLMFAHVSPEADSYAETISTLKFAQRVSTVELGTARLNKESRDIRELKEQIESLKKALARKEAETSLLSHKVKEARSPPDKSKLKTERTPPRPRRLSIENPNIVKTGLLMNSEDKKELKFPSEQKTRTVRSPAPRLRRLSLEGPNSGKKDHLQIKKSEAQKKSINGVVVESPHVSCSMQSVWKDGSNYLKYQGAGANVKVEDPGTFSESVCNFQADCGVFQNAEVNSGTENCSSIGSGSSSGLTKACTPVCSNGASQAQRTEMENITRIPLRLTNTPETPAQTSKLYQIGMQNEQKSQLYNARTNRKGSQIKKSLQTIGKLINASERRNRQDQLETCTPIHCKINNNDVKAPITAVNSRALRRQSLTVGLDTSRRSSLGGKSTDSYSIANRNARTPPPVHPSANMAEQWL